ncbi:MAG: sulfite exporter TauE/SafE family protein [Myxococcales bacterium]|nr:sulfite exporter TauE/SafE family protein [Myxococcales bacterium]
MIDSTFALFAVLVFAGYTTQTMIGFGSLIICVTLGAHLYPIQTLIPLVVPLSIAQCGYIVTRHHDGVDWRLLLRQILPIMGVGMVGGFLVFEFVQGPWLRSFFAILVMVLASRELYFLLRVDPERNARPMSRAESSGWILGAGVIHGIYAAGGPMLVYAVNRMGLSKHAFRSTLSTVWLVLNTGLVITYWRTGRFDAESVKKIGLLLLTVPLGIWAGEHLHARVDERRFRVLVFSILIVAALSLLIR